MSKVKAKIKKFRAPLEAIGTGLGWRVVYLPFSVKAVFGSGARVPVRGTANGAPFRTTLFAVGDGRHMLHLNKKVQAEADLHDIGETVDVVIELDIEERTVAVPAVLKKVLSEDKSLLKFFTSLT